MVFQQLCCVNLHIQLQGLQSMRSVFVCCYRGIYCVEWWLWCMYFWTEVSAWCTPIAMNLVHLSSADLNSGIGPCTASGSFKLPMKRELLELLMHAVNWRSIGSCSGCKAELDQTISLSMRRWKVFQTHLDIIEQVLSTFRHKPLPLLKHRSKLCDGIFPMKQIAVTSA